MELLWEILSEVVLEGFGAALTSEKTPKIFRRFLLLILFSLTMFFFVLAYLLQDHLGASLMFLFLALLLSGYLISVLRLLQKRKDQQESLPQEPL